MSNSYVASHAILRCSCGSDFTILTVSNSRSVKLCGKPMANIGDNSVLNIHYYGICCAAGSSKACMPITPNKWEGGKHDCLVQGEPALLKTSVLRCMCGGVITLLDDGQSPLSIEEKLGLFNRMKEIEEQDTSIPRDNLWLEFGLDIAELLPFGIGSIIGIVRSYAKGDIRGILTNLVFLGLDLYTFGTAGTIVKTLKIIAKTKPVTKAATKATNFLVKVGKKRINKFIKDCIRAKEDLLKWNFKRGFSMPDFIQKLWGLELKVLDRIENIMKEKEEEETNERELENMKILNNVKSNKYKKVKTGAIGVIRIPPKECSVFE